MRRARWMAFLLVLLAGACTPLRPLEPEDDASVGDTGARPDARGGDSGAADAPRMDAPGLDAPQPDAPLDAPPPDVSIAEDTPRPTDAGPDAWCMPHREECNARDDDCNGLVDDGARCADGCVVESFAGHTYQFCPGAVPIDVAFTRCDGWGYHLVLIEGAAENDWVTATAIASGLGEGIGPGQSVTSIGLRRGVGPTYAWDDGSPAAFTSWDVGEPDGVESCARIRTSTGLWSDCPCSQAYDFVCETP